VSGAIGRNAKIRSADADCQHPPPHFHARYGEFEATIGIGTLAVMQDQLPQRALIMVQEWAMMHREELELNWRLCRQNARPANIDPLP
jgi:hypothetical protein